MTCAHSHASFLVNQGFSPLVIKKRLGHDNIEITLNTYSHLYPSQQTKLLDVMKKLGKMSVPKKQKQEIWYTDMKKKLHKPLF